LVGNEILWNEGSGIFIGQSSNNTVKDNNVSENGHGITLYTGSHNNIVENNIVSSNNANGINLTADSRNNTVVNNTVSNNDNGISLWIASYNRLYHNSLIGNVVQATDDFGINYWNDSYPSGGNYWSDWSPTCTDLYNGAITPQTSGSPDGLCDDKRVIDADSADLFPLTQPWSAGPDTAGPVISNLQPDDSSTTIDDTPVIGADYHDISGIDTNSVVLIVNGIDMTSSATVTATGVTYTPSVPLANQPHDVYLEVNDTLGNHANATWSFTVDTTLAPDTTAPTINNLQPNNQTTIDENQPVISASYSDGTGINTTSVLLMVDGQDVTSSATITVTGISYTPPAALADGVHIVYQLDQPEQGDKDLVVHGGHL
jgi:parallel beta-helix repeat protein